MADHGGDGGGGEAHMRKQPNWMLAALTVLAWLVLAALIIDVPRLIISAVTR